MANWPLPAIDGAVREERAEKAPVVVAYDVGILPLTSDLDAWLPVGAEIAKKRGIVVGVQGNLFPIGVGADAATHAPAEMHAKCFTAGRTYVSEASNGWSRVNTASGGARLESDIHDIFSALGLRGAPSLPIWDDMELSSEEEAPRSEHGGDEQKEYNSTSENQDHAGQAAQASPARAGTPRQG